MDMTQFSTHQTKIQFIDTPPEAPVAVNASQLPSKIREAVRILRLQNKRPVYCREWRTRCILEDTPGTPGYGDLERALLARGYKLVLGE